MENPSARAEEARNSIAERIEQRRAQQPPDAWRIECNDALDAMRAKLDAATEPMAIAISFGPRDTATLENSERIDSAPRLPSVPVSVYPPIPMLLWCPECGARHVDKGEFASTKHHHTHACQNCGHCWRPAIVATVGVQFLPGFKDE